MKLKAVYVIAVGILYLGVAVPGWVVAAEYEPPQPPSRPLVEATTHVVSERLLENWSVPGEAVWDATRSLDAPEGISLNVSTGDVLSSGLVWSSRRDYKIAIECPVPPAELYPHDKGKKFIRCIQKYLKATTGYFIPESELEEGRWGFYSMRAMSEVLEAGNFEQDLTSDSHIAETVKARDVYLDAKHQHQEILEKIEKLEDRIDSLRQGGYDNFLWAALTAQLAGHKSTASEYKARRSKTHRILQDLKGKSEGLVLAPQNYISIPSDRATTVVATPTLDDPTVELAFGSQYLKAQLPAAIVDTVSKQWVVNDVPIAEELVAFGELSANSDTGVPEVEVRVNVGGLVEVGELGTLKLIANDTEEEVLSVPAGALIGPESDGHLEVKRQGQWERVEVSGTRRVAGRIIIEPDLGIEEGEEVRLQ